jgi:hypothetical protein
MVEGWKKFGETESNLERSGFMSRELGNHECLVVLLCDDSACGSEHVCTLVRRLVSSLEVMK